MTSLLRSDFIVPFQLENAPVRGRLLRISTVLDDILSKHNYPDQVSALLAEAITLVTLLGSWLKYEGIFTLQAQGNGPVKLLVADYTHQGAVRGYAQFDASDLSVIPNSFSELMGEGFLTFTVDQSAQVENTSGRYQGIVEMKGESLTEAIRHYFQQSEQLRTDFRLAIEKVNHHWHAGAISIQSLPPESELQREDLADDNAVPPHWDEARAYIGTCTPAELLNADLHPDQLLFNLYHEMGIRTYPPVTLRHNCRCSVEKLKDVAAMLSAEERDELQHDGVIDFTCEFCNSHYKVNVSEIQLDAETQPV